MTDLQSYEIISNYKRISSCNPFCSTNKFSSSYVLSEKKENFLHLLVKRIYSNNGNCCQRRLNVLKTLWKWINLKNLLLFFIFSLQDPPRKSHWIVTFYMKMCWINAIKIYKFKSYFLINVTLIYLNCHSFRFSKFFFLACMPKNELLRRWKLAQEGEIKRKYHSILHTFNFSYRRRFSHPKISKGLKFLPCMLVCVPVHV